MTQFIQQHIFANLTDLVSFHSPIQRLNDRSSFRKNYQLTYKSFPNNLQIDLFTLYDAVIKRGFYKHVNDENRWNQIHQSLFFYNLSPQTLRTNYQTHLLQYETKFKASRYSYQQKIKFPFPKIQRYFTLPKYFFTVPVYQLSESPNPVQLQFSKNYFQFLDEYLCIRSIFMTSKIDLKVILQKVPSDYYDKVAVVCKFLLLNGVVNIKQLDKNSCTFLKIYTKQYPSKYQIAIIGYNIRSYFLAKLLESNGFVVTIFDQLKKPTKEKYIEDVIEMGLIHFKLGKFDPLYKFMIDEIGIEKIGEDIIIYDGKGEQVQKKQIQFISKEFIRLLFNIIKKNPQNQHLSMYSEMKRQIDNLPCSKSDKKHLLWNLEKELLFSFSQSASISQVQSISEILQLVLNKRSYFSTASSSTLFQLKIDSINYRQKPEKRIIIRSGEIDRIDQNNGYVRMVNQVQIKKKDKIYKYDYMIYSGSNYFIDCLINNSNILVDSPNFSKTLLQNIHLQNLQTESYTYYLFQFAEEIWKAQLDIISTYDCQFADALFFVNYSKALNSESLICFFKKRVDQSQRNIERSLIQMMSVMINPKICKALIKDTFILNSLNFRLNCPKPHIQHFRCLHPTKPIFLLLPILCQNPKSISILHNIFSILSLLMKNIYQLDAYEKGKKDELKLRKKQEYRNLSFNDIVKDKEGSRKGNEIKIIKKESSGKEVEAQQQKEKRFQANLRQNLNIIKRQQKNIQDNSNINLAKHIDEIAEKMVEEHKKMDQDNTQKFIPLKVVNGKSIMFPATQKSFQLYPKLVLNHIDFVKQMFSQNPQKLALNIMKMAIDKPFQVQLGMFLIDIGRIKMSDQQLKQSCNRCTLLKYGRINGQNVCFYQVILFVEQYNKSFYVIYGPKLPFLFHSSFPSLIKAFPTATPLSVSLPDFIPQISLFILQNMILNCLQNQNQNQLLQRQIRDWKIDQDLSKDMLSFNYNTIYYGIQRQMQARGYKYGLYQILSGIISVQGLLKKMCSYDDSNQLFIKTLRIPQQTIYPFQIIHYQTTATEEKMQSIRYLPGLKNLHLLQPYKITYKCLKDDRGQLLISNYPLEQLIRAYKKVYPIFYIERIFLNLMQGELQRLSSERVLQLVGRMWYLKQSDEILID